MWLSAHRGDAKGICIDFSVKQTGHLVFGTDDENELRFSWKLPAAVCDGLPVNAANSDKNHKLIKLNVTVIDISLHLAYRYMKWT